MQKWKANVFVQKKIQGKSNKDQEGGSGESVGQVWRVLLSGSFGEKRKLFVEQWELSFIDKKHNERKEISFIVCHVHFPEEYWKKWGRKAVMNEEKIIIIPAIQIQYIG